MIFGIVIIVLVLLVAYFHYMQGLLNGVISAVCAAIAAALALGFHENVIAMIAQGKMADQTHALVLVGMFALIYLILRIIFDKMVPGQIRFPAIVDKIGGAVAGLIAGVLGIGILAVAAQTLPFGPAVGDYARWEIEDREVKVPTTGGRMLDAHTRDEMKSGDPIKPDDRGAGLLLPVDDIVVNFVNKLSDGGSLAGERSLASVHPAYNDESFFQRLGIQLGGKHVAMNTAKLQQAKVEGVYIIQQVPQGEAEIPEIRQRENLKPLASTNARAILVVRVEFSDNATDSDKRVRLAPVGVRLVAGGKNYFPLGTLDASAGVVYANKPDDFLLIEPNQPVDFVFDVSRGDVFAPGPKDAKELTIADGVFVEIKRLVRESLAGKKVADAIESAGSGVIRKPEAQASKVEGVSLNASPSSSAAAAPATAAPAPATPAPTAPATPAPTTPAPTEVAATPTPPSAAAEEKGAFKFVTTSTGGKFFAPVSVGKAAAAATDEFEQELNSGKAVMRAKKIAKLEVQKNETLEELGTGTGKVNALFIPAGKTMIQVNGTAHAAAPWRWAENLSKIELVDDKNGRHKPYGAFTKATDAGKNYLIGNYDCDNPVAEVAEQDCTPTDVHIFFLIPENTVIKSISFEGEKMTDISVGDAATKPSTRPATQGSTK